MALLRWKRSRFLRKQKFASKFLCHPSRDSFYIFNFKSLFATHYLQGLDSLNRNDYVNILTKDDLGLFKLENLSSIISRTDLKKSEVINKTITNAGQLQEEQLLLEEYVINQVAPAGEPSNKTRD